MTTFDEPVPDKTVTMPLLVYEQKLDEARLEGYDEGYDACLEQFEEEEEDAVAMAIEDGPFGPCFPAEFEVSDEDADER